MRAEGFEALDKRDRTPVTEADLAADRAITAGLMAAFPDDGLLSEESGFGDGGRRERTWVIDPLDGTEAFVDGHMRGYAVQIGLLLGDRAGLGVVYEPRFDRLFYAVRGDGAWLVEGGGEPVRVAVSEAAELGAMRLVTSSSIGADLRARLLSVGLGDGGAYRSVGIKVGEVVTRSADVYVSHHPVKFWDSCAPLVILEEAGGVATHLDGSPFTYPFERRSARHPGGPFVCSNGTRHEALCRAFRAVWHG